MESSIKIYYLYQVTKEKIEKFKHIYQLLVHYQIQNHLVLSFKAKSPKHIPIKKVKDSNNLISTYGNKMLILIPTDSIIIKVDK